MNRIFNNSDLIEFRRSLRKDQTDAERLLWNNLRNRRLSGVKFFRQYSVGKYIVDFFAPTIRLAIEVDGGQHNDLKNKLSDRQRSYDQSKYNIRVLRFWNNDVLTSTEAVLEKILTYITPPASP